MGRRMLIIQISWVKDAGREAIDASQSNFLGCERWVSSDNRL
jgi:hypothetical protein